MSNPNHNNPLNVSQSSDGTLHLTIPLTISVRLGAPGQSGAVASTSGTANNRVVAKDVAIVNNDSPQLKTLLFKAEEFRGRPYIPADDAQRGTDYYSDIDTAATPEEFYDALSNLLSDTHTSKLGYSPSSHLYPWVDRQPGGEIRSIYTGEKFEQGVNDLIRETFQAEEKLRQLEASLRSQESVSLQEKSVKLDALEASLGFNCEHVVPQSWFRKQSPMRGDLHHLFACETKCNSFRSNTPYFDFVDFDEKVRQGCGRSEQGKFEPSQGKAEVARATLYFLLRYPNIVDNGELPLDRLPTVIEWAKSEPPSTFEKHRNAAIFEVQGNRNPLVDHPEWIGLIDFEKGIG